MMIINDIKLDYNDVLIVPKRSTLSSRSEVDITRHFVFKHSQNIWSGVPIIGANMTSIASFQMAHELNKNNMMLALHKYFKFNELSEFFANQTNFEYNWYTTGISEDEIKKFAELYTANSNINKLCVDVANGYQEQFITTIKKLRDQFPNVTIMAGNVVTPEITEELILSGADIVKIGIGSGVFCETRIKTGVGYPQLSATIECADAAHGLNGLICSDGGCNNPGDIAKSFAGGADFVMIGGMLSGHDESDGKIVTKDGKKYIESYGMSSETAMNLFNNGMPEYRTSEGRTVLVECKGPVAKTIQDILGGLRSTLTYTGSKSLKNLSKRSTFVRVNQQYNDKFE